MIRWAVVFVPQSFPLVLKNTLSQPLISMYEPQQTWIEAGCKQEAQYWAVAANDVEALRSLARMQDVIMDRENLQSLAKVQ